MHAKRRDSFCVLLARSNTGLAALGISISFLHLFAIALLAPSRSGAARHHESVVSRALDALGEVGRIGSG